ncbi:MULTISPECIES: hypothetical protein [Oxalobacteraceae]|uniref:hypothetical protein n=1 Tax=Herminiimonas sp. Marseille-P9896 TaxID=2742211 RepID=UPI001589CB73|nr:MULTISPECIES: hypothetical protein [Oxalobacteraceae]
MTQTTEFDDQRYLVDWIHKAEWIFPTRSSETGNLSSRTPSLVTDLHFEHYLIGRSELGLDGDITFGWSVCEEHRTMNRHWYKISEKNQNPQTDLNKAFILSVAQASPKDRFFVVDWSVEEEQNAPPSLNWKIKEVIVNAGNIKWASNQKLAEYQSKTISKSVKAALESRKNCEHNGLISKWLMRIGSEHLKRLLITRCLMNFGGLYLTDIDAVGTDTSGRTQIIEFKRKDPAKGNDCYQLLPLPPAKETISTYLNVIATELDPIKKNKVELNATFKNKDRWKQMPAEACFGLDTSHAKNIELCERTGMIYRHIIWNNDEKTPGNLLEADLTPVHFQNLLMLTVCAKHIEKISRTGGRDSGSYTTNTRFQLMIPEKIFEPVKIAPY